MAEKTVRRVLKAGRKLVANGHEYKGGDTVDVTEKQLKAWADAFESIGAPPQPEPVSTQAGRSGNVPSTPAAPGESNSK